MRLELTRRADYGIRAMIAIARATPEVPLSTPRIADAMAIPVRFLPQVMADLARAGLVDSTGGRRGGYRLGRPASEISLLEVIEALEGDARRPTVRAPRGTLRTGRVLRRARGLRRRPRTRCGAVSMDARLSDLAGPRTGRTMSAA